MTQTFDDIETGDVYWLCPVAAMNTKSQYHCQASFTGASNDGKTKYFDCVNGAWEGELQLLDCGKIELKVCYTGTKHIVAIVQDSFIKEKDRSSERSDDDEIAF